MISLKCSLLKDEERYYADHSEEERDPADIPTAELKPSNYHDLHVLRDVLTSVEKPAAEADQLHNSLLRQASAT